MDPKCRRLDLSQLRSVEGEAAKQTRQTGGLRPAWLGLRLGHCCGVFLVFFQGEHVDLKTPCWSNHDKSISWSGGVSWEAEHRCWFGSLFFSEVVLTSRSSLFHQSYHEIGWCNADSTQWQALIF